MAIICFRTYNLFKRCGNITGKYLSNNVDFLPPYTVTRFQRMSYLCKRGSRRNGETACRPSKFFDLASFLLLFHLFHQHHHLVSHSQNFSVLQRLLSLVLDFAFFLSALVHLCKSNKQTSLHTHLHHGHQTPLRS